MPPIAFSPLGLMLAAAMSVSNVFTDVARKHALQNRDLIPETFWIGAGVAVAFVLVEAVRLALGASSVIRDSGPLFGIASLHPGACAGLLDSPRARRHAFSASRSSSILLLRISAAAGPKMLSYGFAGCQSSTVTCHFRHVRSIAAGTCTDLAAYDFAGVVGARLCHDHRRNRTRARSVKADEPPLLCSSRENIIIAHGNLGTSPRSPDQGGRLKRTRSSRVRRPRDCRSFIRRAPSSSEDAAFEVGLRLGAVGRRLQTPELLWRCKPPMRVLSGVFF